MTTIDLSGRTALVTGSTAGIGRAIAAGLAAAGATVGVNGRTRESVDLALKSALKSLVAVPGDVTQGAEGVREKLPQVDSGCTRRMYSRCAASHGSVLP